MPRRKKNGADDDAVVGNKGHNAKALDHKIIEVFKKQCAFDEQIKSIQADRREVRGELKAMGMTLADFDAECRLMKLEAEDRAVAMDNRQIVRDAFAQLAPGETADWVKAQETAGANA